MEQVLIDIDDHNDWMVRMEVDLAASRAMGAPKIRLLYIGVIGE